MITRVEFSSSGITGRFNSNSGMRHPGSSRSVSAIASCNSLSIEERMKFTAARARPATIKPPMKSHFIHFGRGRFAAGLSVTSILLISWLSCERPGRSGRLTALRHIPETEAQVGVRFARIFVELAAIVLAVRADGVNDHAIIQAAIAQRRGVEWIERHSGEKCRHQVCQGIGPAVVRAPV